MGIGGFYEDGYGAGQAAASAASREVKKAKDSTQLGQMAGECLDRIKDQSPFFFVKHILSWSLGFYAGYMDRSDEVRGG